MRETNFAPGQVVRLRANRERQGVVQDLLAIVGGEPRYRVFHSPTDIQDYFASQLESIDKPADNHGEKMLAAEKGVDPLEFSARLTAARLSHPQVDTIYALYAARIQHIPFQYKPLLRLLRSDRPRILIADEVGVGKTIEAGLILKELQARQQLNTVIIVCPKSLTNKWRVEMRRFDEDFSVLDSGAIRYCLNEAYLDSEWPSQYNRAIVSLEALRLEQVLYGPKNQRGRPKKGSLELDLASRFGLLIVDEAHHVRNPETLSYEAVRYLSEQSEAAVFLSATPVHIGAQNLQTLLNLLRPDLFPDETVLTAMVEPNSHLTRAMQHVRTQQPSYQWQLMAADQLDAAALTSWGSQTLVSDPRFEDWRHKLRQQQVESAPDRVRCVRDLEEVHTLAHVMNRTRRRDIGRFTIREPHTVSVPFTEEQERFYAALIGFRRKVLSLQYDPRIVNLVLDTLQRQAASCLPTLVPALSQFLRTGRFASNDVSDDPESDELALEHLPPQLISEAHSLLAMGESLPPEDPKQDRLLEVVQASMDADGPGKVLVFSFFLHTLDYLQRALANARVRVATVTGRIPDEERETLRDRFRLPRTDPQALDVLLSSEVGCEGLDYEFCDRLVNYDIPWNPMRIEQRIGRIDRFGQKADKVQIFNFITPGTVEDRIYFRCFDRIGIFRDTVGDLEAVLGDLVYDLNQIALDPSLTPQQAEAKALQMADNAVRLAEEQRRLEEESSGLVGLDEAYLDDVRAVQDNGRFVAPDDLRTMVSAYLADLNVGGRIVEDEQSPGLYRLRMRKEAKRIVHDHIGKLDQHDRPTVDLLRWLESDSPYYQLTFNQHIATENREIPFVTPIHPLAKVAVEYWKHKGLPFAGRLSVSHGDAAFHGRYIFACDIWETISINPEIQLVTLAWNLDNGRLAAFDSEVILGLIGRADHDTSSIELAGPMAEAALAALDEHAYNLREQALADLREQNNILVTRRMASLDAHYRSRLNRVDNELNQVREERIVRMRTAERTRIEHEYQRLRTSIEDRIDADITTRRIAVGMIEVHGAE